VSSDAKCNHRRLSNNKVTVSNSLNLDFNQMKYNSQSRPMVTFLL